MAHKYIKVILVFRNQVINNTIVIHIKNELINRIVSHNC